MFSRFLTLGFSAVLWNVAWELKHTRDRSTLTKFKLWIVLLCLGQASPTPSSNLMKRTKHRIELSTPQRFWAPKSFLPFPAVALRNFEWLRVTAQLLWMSSGANALFWLNQMWYKAIAQFSCQVELQHTATSQRFQIFLLPDRDWNDSIEASRSKNSEHPSYVHVRKNHASLAEQTLRIIVVLMW